MTAQNPDSAAMVVHDLLNPIAAALGYAQVLADPARTLSPERRQLFAEEIVASLQKVRDRLPAALGIASPSGATVD